MNIGADRGQYILQTHHSKYYEDSVGERDFEPPPYSTHRLGMPVTFTPVSLAIQYDCFATAFSIMCFIFFGSGGGILDRFQNGGRIPSSPLQNRPTPL